MPVVLTNTTCRLGRHGSFNGLQQEECKYNPQCSWWLPNTISCDAREAPSESVCDTASDHSSCPHRRSIRACYVHYSKACRRTLWHHSLFLEAWNSFASSPTLPTSFSPPNFLMGGLKKSSLRKEERKENCLSHSLYSRCCNWDGGLKRKSINC